MTAAEFKDFVLAGCQIAVTGGVLYGAYFARKLEKNTNSIKDALVRETGDAAFLKGRATERKSPS